MRFLLWIGIGLIAFYQADACFYGGMYFDAAHQIAVQLRQNF